MAKSFFGPNPPEPEPEEYGTPCPNCGDPRLARDADRWCESCRRGIGLYAEFACGWNPDPDAKSALASSANWRQSQRRTLPDFYEFSELAREAVGDAEFTEATLEKLEALLLRPKVDGGMFDTEDRELLFRTPRSEVMAFLRKRLQRGKLKATGFHGGNALCEALGIHPKRCNSFLRQLSRKRQNHDLDDGCWIEAQDRQKNGPAYLYRAEADAIQKLAERYIDPEP